MGDVGKWVKPLLQVATVTMLVFFVAFSYMELRRCTLRKLRAINLLLTMAVLGGGWFGLMVGAVAEGLGAGIRGTDLGFLGALFPSMFVIFAAFLRLGKASLWPASLCVDLSPNPAPTKEVPADSTRSLK